MDTAQADIEKLRVIVRSDPWYMLRMYAEVGQAAYDL
jgi:hypothetical protein